MKTRNISILTRITDQKIWCVYIHVYKIIKNWGPGLYNSIHHTIFWVSLIENRREVHMFYLAREVGKFGHVFAEKR